MVLVTDVLPPWKTRIPAFVSSCYAFSKHQPFLPSGTFGSCETEAEDLLFCPWLCCHVQTREQFSGLENFFLNGDACHLETELK